MSLQLIDNNISGVSWFLFSQQGILKSHRTLENMAV